MALRFIDFEISEPQPAVRGPSPGGRSILTILLILSNCFLKIRIHSSFFTICCHRWESLPRLSCLVPSLHISQGSQFHDLDHLWIMCSVTDKEEIRPDNIFFKVIKLIFTHRFRFDLIGIHIISSSFREYIIKPFCQIRSHLRKKAGGAFISIPIRPSAPLEHLQLPSAVLQIQRQTVHYTKVREGNCVFVHRRYSNRQQFENSCF
jgi:hypothetical protein